MKTLHKKRLLKLAAHLGKKEIPGFNMMNFCHCALHEVPKLFPKDWVLKNDKPQPRRGFDGSRIKAAAKYFGEEYNHLWSGLNYSSKEQARIIRAFVAKQ